MLYEIWECMFDIVVISAVLVLYKDRIKDVLDINSPIIRTGMLNKGAIL